MAEHVHLRGTFYEVGKSLGTLRRTDVEAIVDNLRQSETYGKLQSYLETDEGSCIYKQLRDTCRRLRADHLDELQGVADGAAVSFDDLFLLNVPELAAVAGILPEDSHGVSYGSMFNGCTNVSMETDDGQAYLVHTEDIDPFFKGKDLMLSVEIVDKDGHLIEKWTEYNIPGVVPGSSFGFNSHGVMFAHNNIYPKDFNKLGIPRRFVCRKLMTVRDPSESKAIMMQNPGIASACTLTYLKCNGGMQTSGDLITVLETVGVDNSADVAEFNPKGVYYHCNILQHLPRECHPEESSVHRAAVVSQYINRGAIRTRDDLLQAVSDDTDHVFPVFRSGKYPDYLATGATGLFDLREGTLTVYTGKPTTTPPIHVLRVA